MLSAFRCWFLVTELASNSALMGSMADCASAGLKKQLRLEQAAADEALAKAKCKLKEHSLRLLQKAFTQTMGRYMTVAVQCWHYRQRNAFEHQRVKTHSMQQIKAAICRISRKDLSAAVQ